MEFPKIAIEGLDSSHILKIFDLFLSYGAKFYGTANQEFKFGNFSKRNGYNARWYYIAEDGYIKRRASYNLLTNYELVTYEEALILLNKQKEMKKSASRAQLRNLYVHEQSCNQLRSKILDILAARNNVMLGDDDPLEIPQEYFDDFNSQANNLQKDAATGLGIKWKDESVFKSDNGVHVAKLRESAKNVFGYIEVVKGVKDGKMALFIDVRSAGVEILKEKDGVTSFVIKS